MEVLHQRLGHAGHVVGRTDQGRDRHQAGPLGGPPPPLARHELVTVLVPTDEYGLQNADLADRSGQRAQRLFIEILPRLERVRVNCAHWYIHESGAPVGSRLRRDECPEPLTQRAATRHR